MPINIGIIGAENRHATAIAKILNVHKRIRGVSVTHLWGETDAIAATTAEAGRIPVVVKNPEDMLGEIDGVMCDQRDGKYHVPSVMPFLKAGIPIFLDKPMTTSLSQARAFLKKRRELGVPVTTLSSVPFYEGVAAFRKKLKTLGALQSLHLSGPGDYRSPYGGIWFYGIHQADLMVELLGTNPQTALFIANRACSAAVITYPDDVTVTLSFAHPGERVCRKGFAMIAVGREGWLAEPAVPHPNQYAITTRLFTRMFRTGKEPFSDERMLAPIAVLDAVEKSLKTGRCARVARVGV